MPRKKKAAPTPVRDLMLSVYENPSLDILWPLPTSYACSRCGSCLLSSGPCPRRNSRGFPLCTGVAVQVTLYRARCRCTSWTVTERQLLSRCGVCHRRIEAWDPDLLLAALRGNQGRMVEDKERGPVDESTGPGQRCG